MLRIGRAIYWLSAIAMVISALLVYPMSDFYALGILMATMMIVVGQVMAAFAPIARIGWFLYFAGVVGLSIVLWKIQPEAMAFYLLAIATVANLLGVLLVLMTKPPKES